jgi:hypothetical protein
MGGGPEVAVNRNKLDELEQFRETCGALCLAVILCRSEPLVPVCRDGSCVLEVADCRRTGCSGQICADHDVITTCEWLPEYGCYQTYGLCERQPDSECAWTVTDELRECLESI